jgi:hypothetical protein
MGAEMISTKSTDILVHKYFPCRVVQTMKQKKEIEKKR